MKYTEELKAALRRGEWVYGINEDVSRELRKVEDMCHRFNSLSPLAQQEREEILRGMLGSVGEGVVVHSPFRCDFGCNTYIGNHVVVNYVFKALDEAEVRIVDNVFIGPDVSIFTVIHAMDPKQRNAGVMTARGVTIENDTWICGDVTILPGVTIGRGTVVGAGSVVTRTVEPGVLVAGNPARVLRRISEEDRLDESVIFGEL